MSTDTAKQIECPDCNRCFATEVDLENHCRVKHRKPVNCDPQTAPDWSRECSNCGDSPIVPATGLCGPCTWGEADTAMGNW